MCRVSRTKQDRTSRKGRRVVDKRTEKKKMKHKTKVMAEDKNETEDQD